jgi:exonuclease SbcD
MSRHVFLHIGDGHFGPGDRNVDRYEALEQIIEHGLELAVKRELAAWLWPGDLGHARLPIADTNTLDACLVQMAMMAPVVICYGNHDQPGDLDGFARLNSVHPIHVIASPQVVHLKTATNALAAIFVLPYPHRAGLVSAGTAHSEVGDTARALLEPIFMDAAAQLREAAIAGALTLAIGHVNVGGSVASTGQPQIGREIELDPALLARLESAQYIGLNHIHKHQTVHRAVYAGSICRLDFGEREEKGFIEVELDGPAPTHPVSAWHFVPLDVAQQLDITGELTREQFILETINGESHGFCPRWNGADVRVRYRYLKADAGAIDVDHIREAFAGARSLKLEGQPQLTHEMRAPEIAAAVTLEEKVARYCERHQIVATAGLRSKLTALQSTAPEVVLSDVTRSLATVGSTQPTETVGA